MKGEQLYDWIDENFLEKHYEAITKTNSDITDYKKLEDKLYGHFEDRAIEKAEENYEEETDY